MHSPQLAPCAPVLMTFTPRYLHVSPSRRAGMPATIEPSPSGTEDLAFVRATAMDLALFT